MRVDIEGDRRFVGCSPNRHQPHFAIENDARRRIQHRQRLCAAAGVYGKIALVLGFEAHDVAANLSHALAADHVVRRRWSLLRDLR